MRSPKWWLALASGALLGLTFPPFDLPWPLLPMAVAGWFVSSRSDVLRTTLWRSLAFAMGFYLLLLKWMLIVGVDAWILLAFLQSAYFLVIGAVRFRMDGRRFELLALALAWIGQDWLRDHAPFAAFGWGQLAFANVDAPWAMLAPVGGQLLVTGAAVLAGVAIGRIFIGGFVARLIGFGTAVLALSVPLLVSQPQPLEPTTKHIALVQAGVDHTGLGFLGDRRSVLYRHRDLTVRALANTDVDAVLWPENASDADPFTDSLAAEAIRSAVDAAGRPIVLGAVIDPITGRANVSLRAIPGSEELKVIYQKQRLVPFGEFLPFRDLLTHVTDRVEFLPRDFIAGNDPGRLSVEGVPMGIVICFEVADEDLVRTALGSGASALIVQTNNATYAGTGQSEQQLRISQLRARTFGLPVYVISTNGPTAEIAVDGTVVQRVAEGDSGVLKVQVVSRTVGSR